MRVGIVTLMIALCTSGCSKLEKYPDAYGAFASKNGEWVRIGEEKTRVEFEVMPNTRFLVHDKRLGIVQDGGFRLMRSKFIRNVIEQNPDGGSRKVKPQNSWETDESDAVSVVALAVKERPEMIILQPQEKLPEGVYGLKTVDKSLESVFVGGMNIFTPGGREKLCVDRVKTTAWGIPMGEKDRLVPCSASPVTSGASPGPPTSESSAELAKTLERWAMDPSKVDLQQFSGLLARGAKFDRHCHKGSVLRCAVLTRRADLVEAMLNSGAKPQKEEALVSQAAKTDDVETVAVLLKHRFSPNEGSSALCAPIFEAISANGIATAKLLIEHGANVNIDGGLCGVPLTAAENEKKTEIAAILRRSGAKP